MKNKRVRNLYKRYLNKHDASDIWARELINGLFEIDDMNPLERPYFMSHEEFLTNYDLYVEKRND